jgi:hypothetical protein
MGDSTTMEDIPLSVQIAGVYIDGQYGVETQAQLEHRFPHARYGHVFVDVNGSRPDADARDWETGDKSGDLEDWVKRHNAHTGKKDAVIYCNRSTIPEVRQLTKSQLLGVDYWLWVATLDGEEYRGPGVMGCQKDGEKQTGGHWDRSLIYDDRFWRALESSPLPHHPRPNCVAFQKAVRASADNMWGPQTDKNATGLIQAAAGHFPYGVKFAQQVIGTIPDGVWGPHSAEHLNSAVKLAQIALKAMGFDPGAIDGVWGVHTSHAYLAARSACHI